MNINLGSCFLGTLTQTVCHRFSMSTYLSLVRFFLTIIKNQERKTERQTETQFVRKN